MNVRLDRVQFCIIFSVVSLMSNSCPPYLDKTLNFLLISLSRNTELPQCNRLSINYLLEIVHELVDQVSLSDVLQSTFAH